jgi:hypothetical protein
MGPHAAVVVVAFDLVLDGGGWLFVGQAVAILFVVLAAALVRAVRAALGDTLRRFP